MTTRKFGNDYRRVIIIPEEFTYIKNDPEFDNKIINLLKDKPMTYEQINKFYSSPDLISRLHDLCLKGILRKIYNGNIYYQVKKNNPLIKKNLQIVLTNGNRESVFKLDDPLDKSTSKIPDHAYSSKSHSKSNMIHLRFKEGSFKNPKFVK